MRRHSPYNYGFDNPIRFIDPDGMAPIPGAIGLIAWAKGKAANEEAEDRLSVMMGEDEDDIAESNAMARGFSRGYEDDNKKGKDKPEEKNERLNQVNDALGYAGNGEMVLGVAQIGMIKYRQSLSVNNKLGSFSQFRSSFRALGVTSNWLGASSSYLGTPLEFYFNYSSMREGKIGKGRLIYRTAGGLSSLFGGSAVGALLGGGPYGVFGGAVIGGTFWSGEKMYDGFKIWQNKMAKLVSDFENGINKGWVPGM